VRVASDLPLSLVPPKARRIHPAWGDAQILTGYVLGRVLQPRRPADAFASIAFTCSDLWPGGRWNYVFGQASLNGRVGVWSLHRFGDPAQDAAAARLCLRRAISTGVHEIGHMFGIGHCTDYACVMNGSNSLSESDRRPLRPCPVDLAKIVWATGADPMERFRAVANFSAACGLDDVAASFREGAALLAK